MSDRFSPSERRAYRPFRYDAEIPSAMPTQSMKKRKQKAFHDLHGFMLSAARMNAGSKDQAIREVGETFVKLLTENSRTLEERATEVKGGVE